MRLTKQLYFSALHLCPLRYLNYEQDLIILKTNVRQNWLTSLLLYYPVNRVLEKYREDDTPYHIFNLFACIAVLIFTNVLIYLDVLFIIFCLGLLVLHIKVWLGILLTTFIAVGTWGLCVIRYVCDPRCIYEHDVERIKRDLTFDEWIERRREDRCFETDLMAPILVILIGTVVNLICLIIFDAFW